MHLSIKTILEKKLKKKELYVVCLIHVPVHKALYANLSVEKNCYKCVKVYIGVYLWTLKIIKRGDEKKQENSNELLSRRKDLIVVSKLKLTMQVLTI